MERENFRSIENRNKEKNDKRVYELPVRGRQAAAVTRIGSDALSVGGGVRRCWFGEPDQRRHLGRRTSRRLHGFGHDKSC